MNGQKGINITGDRAGNVVITVNAPGRQAIAVTLPAEKVGYIVTALLDTAKAVSSKDRDQKGISEIDWLPLKPSLISLGSSPEPGTEALVFGFGSAKLGVSLNNQQLKTIGEGMLALSAEGNAQ